MEADSNVDPHADKYNDPRVRVTWQGIATLVAIVIGGAIFALLSVQARRTRLTLSTKFWGSTTITAIQLGDEVTLIDRSTQPANEIELTAMPGLGHLRRALLDERHYEWQTNVNSGVGDLCDSNDDTSDLIDDSDANPASDAEASCVSLRFADPTLSRFPATTIDLHLDSGFVGPADGSRRVQMNERVRPALQHQLTLLLNFQQRRADDRN
ncbi:MAG: hypothetical protein AAF539_11905 [Planctomycetota bacterium]